MNPRLADAIYIIGWLQLAVLIASAMIPIRLKWRTSLLVLPRLYRQLYWVYGGYVVLGITGLGLICITNSRNLPGERRWPAVCIYGFAFWGIRLSLQAVFEGKPYLTTWWLKVAYYGLTVLFAIFTVVYAIGAFWR